MACHDQDLAGALLDVRNLYSENLAAHGLGPRSVGWRDEAGQRLRFDKLALLIDWDDGAADFSVADWGCGYGAMFGYLNERYGERLRGYAGYDISPAMLQAAARNVTDPRAVFIEAGDAPAPADYAFVSGTFNVRRGASEATWDRYVRAMVRRLAERSERGLAFNLMTSYVDWRSDELFYADPAQFFSFCRAELSRRVSLIHDYPLYEWTMIVFTGG